MGLDQNIVKVGYDRISKSWRVVRDGDWYFRKFWAFHDWIAKNCICDAGQDSADTYGFLNDVIDTGGNDNCVLIPVKLEKWKELLSILKTLRKAWKNVPEDVREEADIDAAKVDSKEYTEFMELAVDKLPIPVWQYEHYMQYNSGYMWQVDKLYEYVAEICSVHHGTDGLIPGDDPMDEAVLRQLKDKFAAREKLKPIRDEALDKYIKAAADKFCTEEEKKDIFAVCNNQAASEEYWNRKQLWDEMHDYNDDEDEAVAGWCEDAGVEDCRFDRYAYAYDPWY